MAKNEVFISLGSNIGNRPQNLKKAIEAIQSSLGHVTRQSSVYETKPWGKNDQPDFLNQVIGVASDQSPEDCLRALCVIEEHMGRKREEKWGARIIDLDLLYAGDTIVKTKILTLPHPGIPDRKFVLVPMAEIAPDFIHPQWKKNQKQLLNECQDPLDVRLYRLDTSA